jgi:hypothetical protein
MRSVIPIFRTNKYSIFIRNHWSKSFNDSFIFIIDRKSQGYMVDTYRIGLFNFCICFLSDNFKKQLN